MPEFLRRILEQLRGIWSRTNRNQRIILLASVAAVILFIVGMALWAGRVEYVILYDKMTAEEADKIRQELDKMGYPYIIEGTILKVPAKQKDIINIRLAGKGLTPAQGIVGFEVFDRGAIGNLGVTDFERRVNFKRAIEGQLTRIIRSLDKVQDASVVVNLPEERVFLSEQAPVTAVVQIHPKPYKILDQEEINGIRRLVARAVPRLTEDNVAVIGPSGEVLGEISPEEEEHNRVIKQIALRNKEEQRLENKIRVALGKMFGPERFEVIVSRDMNFDKKSTEKKEVSPIVIPREFGDPIIKEGVVVSEALRKEELETTGVPDAIGVPGVESNVPTVKSATTGNIKWKMDDQKRNYDTNQTVTRSETDNWEVGKITASVGIDGDYKLVLDEKGNRVVDETGTMWKREFIPVPQEELDAVRRIVEEAIGFSKDRGDKVVVENVRFRTHDPVWQEEYKREITTQRRLRLLLATVMATLVILLGTVTYRHLARRWRERAEALARQREIEEAAREAAEMERLRSQMSADERRRLELRDSAIKAARSNPEMVAQLLRTWMAEE
ncbi:MAG: flagellar basal-body MS-ring/collar protein FliF [bacterium]